MASSLRPYATRYATTVAGQRPTSPLQLHFHLFLLLESHMPRHPPPPPSSTLRLHIPPPYPIPTVRLISRILQVAGGHLQAFEALQENRPAPLDPVRCRQISSDPTRGIASAQEPAYITITLFGVCLFFGGRCGSAVTRRLLPQFQAVQVSSTAHPWLAWDAVVWDPHGFNPRSGKTISVCPNHKMCFSVHLPYNSKLFVNS